MPNQLAMAQQRTCLSWFETARFFGVLATLVSEIMVAVGLVSTYWVIYPGDPEAHAGLFQYCEAANVTDSSPPRRDKDRKQEECNDDIDDIQGEEDSNDGILLGS